MLFTIIICAAFVGSLTIDASEIEPSWAVLSVADPPISTEDDSNFTYIRTEFGQVKRVPFDQAPEEPAPFFTVEKDVRFELFTPQNPTKASVLVLDDYQSVRNSNFNPKYPTRILVHGWNSEGLLTPRFADAYLVKGQHKVNFIALNWQKGSDTLNYYAARNRVPEVAEHLAHFIDFLAHKFKLKYTDVTIVGHSLGAHISGIAGKKVRGGKIAKIVGLDPASPLFKFEEVETRLDETDAGYVEVIHTCAGLLGMTKPIGMASFYPNGGKSQPGCGWSDVVGMCAHGRSYEYYLESLQQQRPRFLAFQCDSFENLKNKNCTVVNDLVQMGGEPGNKYTEGIFYLETNPEPLYSQGRPGVIHTIMKAHHATKDSNMSGLSSKFIDLVKRKLKRYEEIEPEISTIDSSFESMVL